MSPRSVAPYLFIICAEILAIRIRNNKNIFSINIDNCHILNPQYADDTSLILDGSGGSLKAAIDELNICAKISGLKVNIRKTSEVKNIATIHFFPDLNFIWRENKFTLLGIDFHVDLHRIPKFNYDKK